MQTALSNASLPRASQPQLLKPRLPNNVSRVMTTKLRESKSACHARRSTQAIHCRSTPRGRAGSNRGREEQDKKAKVDVSLGPYKNGALKINLPPVVVDPAELEAAFAAKKAKKYNLKRVNFTSSGAKIGLTVKIEYEAKYSDGPKKGRGIPGVKASMFELDLQEGAVAPWCDLITGITNAGVSGGMGQEESKMISTRFPKEFEDEALQGVAALFFVTVKEISEKEIIPEDTRPEEAQRAELEDQIRKTSLQKQYAVIDADIRRQLEATCVVDTKKVEESVSWAKFGPRSLSEFQWNLIKEEVSRAEGLEFDKVLPFLRSEATNVAIEENDYQNNLSSVEITSDEQSGQSETAQGQFT